MDDTPRPVATGHVSRRAVVKKMAYLTPAIVALGVKPASAAQTFGGSGTTIPTSNPKADAKARAKIAKANAQAAKAKAKAQAAKAKAKAKAAKNKH